MSESIHDITIEVPLGKINIPKSSIAKTSRYSKGKNDALISKWRKTKIAHKQKATQKATYHKPKKGEHLIRYKSKWITMEEYTEIKQQLRTDKQDRLKKAQEEFEALQRKKEYERLKEKTIETIRQGSLKRSQAGNDLLEEHEWLSTQSTNFIFFFKGDTVTPLIENFESISEHFFDKLRGDLNLKKYFAFDEKIEVFLIHDDALWDAVSSGFARDENAAGYAHHYKREVYLHISSNEEKNSVIFAHELSHIFLKEFIIKKMSKKHYIPLWLMEGFASYEGALPEYTLPKEDRIKAIYKNYHIKLDDLLMLHTYPTQIDTRKLFYDEATTLIEFIITTYGRERFNEFITAVIETYNQEERQPENLTKKTSRRILLMIIKNTFLGEYYAGYASFEEAWLRYATA